MEYHRIIEGCKQKDPYWQKELVRTVGPKLKSVCRRYLDEDFEIDEALQRSLIKILNAIWKYDPQLSAFETWAKRITINTIFSMLKKKKGSMEVLGIHPLTAVELEPAIYNQLYVEDLMKLIQQLPEGYRQVLNLFAVEGFSHKEIAALLGISESTSRSQLSRARAILKQKIQYILKKERC